tara:strand:+ start:216 stop:833 length:618 start_codon:yes stop_codon:yes gene_type:complete
VITTDIIIISCLVLSAFFSGIEIAYVSANRIFLEIEKNQNNLNSKMISKITKHPSKFIISMLVGNNISLVIYGIFMGERIIDLFFQNSIIDDSSLRILLYQTIISTIVILLTAEFLPKVFFQLYSNSLIKFFSIPAAFFYYLFSPITFIITKISDLVLKYFFGSESDKTNFSFSKGELGDYIEEQVDSVPNKDHLTLKFKYLKMH